MKCCERLRFTLFCVCVFKCGKIWSSEKWWKNYKSGKFWDLVVFWGWRKKTQVRDFFYVRRFYIWNFYKFFEILGENFRDENCWKFSETNFEHNLSEKFFENLLSPGNSICCKWIWSFAKIILSPREPNVASGYARTLLSIRCKWLVQMQALAEKLS